MITKNIRVIFDTNVWISFFIGKRLSFIKTYISNGKIVIITTDQLLEEITEVTSRKKMQKYFPKESVNDLLSLLETLQKI